MKLSKQAHLFLAILIFTNFWSTDSLGQVKDYYMFPIRPGEVNTVAGTMGELRASHFHAGLDIRTGGRTGLPVYAATDGYVSRAAVKLAGYGKALYLTHPNGETTVYAHLESFNGAIADFILDYQYSNRSLFFNKYFKKGVFPVKRGEVIGHSGNSGSSAGPHLHFEIRDKDQQVLNPLKYHFEEIRDTTPPVFKKLAINQKNGIGNNKRSVYKIKNKNGKYFLNDTLAVKGTVGLELLAHDKLNDANYRCGISEIIFTLDNQLVFRQRIDTINFSDQRNILAHYNYQAYRSTGDKYHKLYIDDGNKLPYYTSNEQKGLIRVSEEAIRKASIKIIDVLGNKSEINFHVSGIKKMQKNHSTATVAYGHKNTTEHDTIQSILITPNKNYTHYSDNSIVTFETNSLFDSVYFSSSYYRAKNEVHMIGNPDLYPLKKSIAVTLKNTSSIADSLKQKSKVYRITNGNYSYIGGVWDTQNISFKTRKFGNYTILTDSIAPTIFPVSVASDNLKFKIKDNLSGIKKFDVFVDNEWILMDYDYKTSLIWTKRKNNLPLSGDVILRVFDNAGNLRIYKTKI